MNITALLVFHNDRACKVRPLMPPGQTGEFNNSGY